MRSKTLYQFGDYELDAESFALRLNGKEVPVEPQVLSLLNLLVENRHQLLSKNEILDELWGHRFVSESALATQIKTLRRVLGDDGRAQKIIKTVHGRGYRFVASVEKVEALHDLDHAEAIQTQASELPAGERQTNLGSERSPLFGREAEILRCIEALNNHRLVSLLGIGGTGKTRLAKTVGRQVVAQYPDGVWFVDLIPVRDGDGIDTAIAAAMGIGMDAGTSRSQLTNTLLSRHALIILDNCEHIEDHVAAALDFFLGYTTEPRFLVTSRDPVDLADEFRFFVEPLQTYANVGLAPATQLFNATAQRYGALESALDEPLVELICARLDGLPLAIELAAAQLKQLTLEELAARLGKRFELLAGRQRTGAVRQDSLVAVLEDTWKLLEKDEQRLVGQLAVFPGQFTMSDIEQVFQSELSQGISFAMSRLVELSLLSRTSRPGAWWRLLETVRIFAFEKLDGDQRQANTDRHAHWILSHLSMHPQIYLQDFKIAAWAKNHYADITAAEDYFAGIGDIANAVHICTAVGLMLQADEGALALAKLTRIEGYIEQTEDSLLLAKLHGMAALCAQVTRNPIALAMHSSQSLDRCRILEGRPDLLINALILNSLTTNFLDPERSQSDLQEAASLAEFHGENHSVRLVTTYQAWSLALQGEHLKAIDVAMKVAEISDQDSFDNPACYAICTIIACQVLDNPTEAFRWTEKLERHLDTEALWGATLVAACSYASIGKTHEAARLCLGIHKRLKNAGRNAWPDLFVPMALIALAEGDTQHANSLVTAVRERGDAFQAFHAIAIYRQLKKRLKIKRSIATDIQTTSDETIESVYNNALERLRAIELS